MARTERILTLYLRLMAGVLLLALPTALLPFEWMDAAHRALGMGELPRAPLIGYLTRSLSLLYGFHGVLLFYLSLDVRRHLALLRFFAALSIAFGVALFVVDLAQGMPWFWTAAEGPSIVAAYGLLLYLLHRAEVSS
jgi:hypothetical protein